MINGIAGVDHVGVGVRDMESMRSFYRDVLGFDRVLGEMPMEDHPAIHGLLRTPRAIHRSMLLGQGGGGLTVALFQAADPPPRPIRNDPRYGDIGVAKLTFAVTDLDAFCEQRGSLFDFCSPPRSVAGDGPGGYRCVYGKDPEGNLLEFVSWLRNSSADGPTLSSIGIAVTDLERSLAFYRDALGFTDVVVAPHGSFSGLVDELTGVPGTMVRSCLVANSEGRGMLELFEVVKPRGRSLPFGTQWGDFGYLQLCLYGTHRDTLMAALETERPDVLLPPQEIDDPEHPAMFLYLRDPDGIPVEIVVGL